MTVELLVLFCISLISLCIGYLLGSWNSLSKKDIEEAFQKGIKVGHTMHHLDLFFAKLENEDGNETKN